MTSIASIAKETACSAMRRQAAVSYDAGLDQLECADLALQAEDWTAAAAHIDRAREQLERSSSSLRALAQSHIPPEGGV